MKRAIKLNFIRKIFRYKISSTLLLIGMSVTFISIFCGGAILNYAKIVEKEIKKNTYNIDKSIGLETINYKDKDRLYELLKVGVGNSSLKRVEIKIGDEGTTVLADIYIEVNEKIHYKIQKGRFPTKQEIERGEKVINIGKGRINDSYAKDNGERYILIEGDEYKVVGIIGAKNTKIYDNKVILYYDCLANNMKKKIRDTYDVIYNLSSNTETTENKWEELLVKINSEHGINTYEYVENIETKDSERMMTSVIFFSLYLVSILNCIIVSEVWLLNRQNEIATRLAFGYSKNMIFKMIYTDLLKISIIASVVSLIICKLLENILNNTLDMLLILSIDMLFFMAIIVIVTTYILSKFLVTKVYKKSVIETLFVKGIE